MKKLSNTEVEFKKCAGYKKACNLTWSLFDRITVSMYTELTFLHVIAISL